MAIEFRSLSKTVGFTGAHCAYTVVPKDLKTRDHQGEWASVHALWNRRQTTKLNGVSYPIQKAAAAIFSPAGANVAQDNIKYHGKSTALSGKGKSAEFTVQGG